MSQLWGTNTTGGYMYSDQLTKVIRAALQPMSRFQQHCDAEDFTDKGYNVGSRYYWNIYSDLGTAGGRLSETLKMPETSMTISQGSGQVYEFGNSVAYSGLLDDLSAHPVKQIIHKALKNDANKAFEAEARAQFFATPLTVEAASGTSATAITLATAGSIASVNNIAMNTTHVKLISDQMKERNIPSYSDGNYRCIGRPSTFRGVKDGLESVHSYVPEGFRMILQGEIGRSYEGIRFFEQTTVASRGYSNAKTDEAYFFGEDTVIEAIICPPEMRGKLPCDFGRDKGVAWYAEEGFALVHTVAAQARIMRWGSLS